MIKSKKDFERISSEEKEKDMTTPRGLHESLPRGIIIRTEVRGTGVTQKPVKTREHTKGRKDEI